jgi:hypothetical protein
MLDDEGSVKSMTEDITEDTDSYGDGPSDD